jgi:hypothetical protein
MLENPQGQCALYGAIDAAWAKLAGSREHTAGSRQHLALGFGRRVGKIDRGARRAILPSRRLQS